MVLNQGVMKCRNENGAIIENGSGGGHESILFCTANKRLRTSVILL